MEAGLEVSDGARTRVGCASHDAHRSGPQVVGLLNDWREPRLGNLALRWSLVIVLSTSAIGAGLLALGARRLPEALESI